MSDCPHCDDSWQEHEVFYILTDLIGELRDHVDGLSGGLKGYQNLWDAQRDARDMADRAEARLREVTNE